MKLQHGKKNHQSYHLVPGKLFDTDAAPRSFGITANHMIITQHPHSALAVDQTLPPPVKGLARETSCVSGVIDSTSQRHFFLI